MSHNTLLHRAVHPVVQLLARTPLRPNHVTALRIATALAAAAGFALGTPQGIWAGSALFILSALLDRIDGELARLTRRFSPLGHWLDLAADFSADALAFLAMGIGARQSWLQGDAVLLGVVAAIGAAALFYQLNRTGQDQPIPMVVRPLDPDDMILLMPVLACCFGLPPVLLLAGVLTPLAALGLMLGRLRR